MKTFLITGLALSLLISCNGKINQASIEQQAEIDSLQKVLKVYRDQETTPKEWEQIKTYVYESKTNYSPENLYKIVSVVKLKEIPELKGKDKLDSLKTELKTYKDRKPTDEEFKKLSYAVLYFNPNASSEEVNLVSYLIKFRQHIYEETGMDIIKNPNTNKKTQQRNILITNDELYELRLAYLRKNNPNYIITEQIDFTPAEQEWLKKTDPYSYNKWKKYNAPR